MRAISFLKNKPRLWVSLFLSLYFGFFCLFFFSPLYFGCFSPILGRCHQHGTPLGWVTLWDLRERTEPEYLGQRIGRCHTAGGAGEDIPMGQIGHLWGRLGGNPREIFQPFGLLWEKLQKCPKKILTKNPRKPLKKKLLRNPYKKS